MDIEKLKYDNDQLLMQLGWLLERVLVKEGEVKVSHSPIAENDVLASLKELKRIIDNQNTQDTN